MSFAPRVTPGEIPSLVGHDHLISWCCSMYLYPDECRLEIPSRGIDAKLLATTSNHILVNIADFAGMEEPDFDVWTSKRDKDSEETGTESEMTVRTEETTIDPEEVTAKVHDEGSKKTESSEKETTSSLHSIESSVAVRIEKIAACSCKRLISISS